MKQWQYSVRCFAVHSCPAFVSPYLCYSSKHIGPAQLNNAVVHSVHYTGKIVKECGVEWSIDCVTVVVSVCSVLHCFHFSELILNKVELSH